LIKRRWNTCQEEMEQGRWEWDQEQVEVWVSVQDFLYQAIDQLVLDEALVEAGDSKECFATGGRITHPMVIIRLFPRPPKL